MAVSILLMPLFPRCALSTDSEAENEYCRELYKGEQFIRCMADGEIVALARQ